MECFSGLGSLTCYNELDGLGIFKRKVLFEVVQWTLWLGCFMLLCGLWYFNGLDGFDVAMGLMF